MRRRNREGVFNNAIYSRVVKAAEDTDVLLGVEEDLNYITRKNNFDNSYMWNNAPRLAETSSSNSFAPPPAPPIRQPGRGISKLKMRQEEVFVTKTLNGRDKKARLEDRRDESSSIHIIQKKNPRIPEISHFQRPTGRDVKREEPEPLPSTSISARTNSLFDYGSKNGRAKKNVSYPSMPEKVPLLLVAQNVSKQVPKMPLRVGHSITYSSLVADICKKSLMPTDDSQLTPPEKPLLSTLNETMVLAAREQTELLKKMKMDVIFPFNCDSESPFISKKRRTDNQAPSFPIDEIFDTPTEVNIEKPVDQRTVRFDDLTVQYDFNQDPEEMFDRSLTGNQYTSPVRSFRANNLFDSNSQTQFPSKDSSIIFLDDDFYG